MFVTFVVVQGHPVSKELSGGRVRVKRNEREIDAIVRRIEQDTRCRVVGTREQRDGPRGGYELTLRGFTAAEGRGPRQPVEGVVTLTLHRGEDAFGPRGARPVRVPSARELAAQEARERGAS